MDGGREREFHEVGFMMIARALAPVVVSVIKHCIKTRESSAPLSNRREFLARYNNFISIYIYIYIRRIGILEYI